MSYPDLPPYDELLEVGVYRRDNPDGAHVAFKEFRDDPEGHPLDTPSGKIEVYSEKIRGTASTGLIHN